MGGGEEELSVGCHWLWGAGEDISCALVMLKFHWKAV